MKTKLHLKKIVSIQFLLLVIFLLVTSLVEAKTIDCFKHKIYCQIVKNSPNINKKYAMRLSNSIYKYSKLYNIDTRIYTAILAQESMYKLSAKNCNSGISMWTKNTFGKYLRDKVCSDFGISQIHWKTVDRYNFDIDKLLTDLNYSVKAGILVLKDFKQRYKNKEQYWWTRYNTSNPKKRIIYKKLVSKYL